MMKECDPTFASLELLGLSDEQSSFILARKNARQIVLLSAGGDDERNSSADHDLCCLQFGNHSTNGGGATGTARQRFCLLIDLFDGRDDSRIGGFKVLHEPVDRGEDDEQVCWQERGYER